MWHTIKKFNNRKYIYNNNTFPDHDIAKQILTNMTNTDNLPEFVFLPNDEHNISFNLIELENLFKYKEDITTRSGSLDMI